MTLREAAQIYVDLVRLEESLTPEQWQAREEVSMLGFGGRKTELMRKGHQELFDEEV